MNRCVRAFTWMVMLSGLSIIVGCSHEDEQTTAEVLTAEGWVLFEAGNFTDALPKFGEAIEKNINYADAYNGRGWSWLGLDSLAVAISDFDEAIAKATRTPDPFAGKAVILRDPEVIDAQLDGVEQDSIRALAIVCADSALNRDLRYVFSHDTRMTWQDLRLIMAQSHYALSAYELAKVQVDSLSPGNSLDPTSNTFVEDLLEEVQRLGETLAGP